MFGTFRTLMAGSAARAEEATRDAFALELIDQKIREAEGSLAAAKGTLASLIQRKRNEERQVETLTKRITDLTKRAQEALDGDREDLAEEAARAIATLENERELRRTTVERLEQKTMRLRQSVEAGHRRIVDLKQGAISARAIRREQDMQMRLNRGVSTKASADEAEELIARVLGRDDPFEQSEILREINEDLNHGGIADRMAAEGFGAATKTTPEDVLKRLKSKK